jgi:DNA replication and repair protein RecF
MRIRQLKLENFRNYRRLTFDFPEDETVVITGNNGLGKTNFLEAIYVLAVTKSFQSHQFEELISWDADEEMRYLRVNGRIQIAENALDLEVFSGASRQYPKTLKMNDVKRKAQDYVGNFLVSTFTPSDTNLVYLSPQIRRRYVDILLSQIDREYLTALLSYRQCLLQRNRLLRDIDGRPKREGELQYWDEQLATFGATILMRRRRCFDELNQRIVKHYEALSNEQVKLEMKWKSWRSVEIGGREPEEVQRSLLRYLVDERKRDISAGSTCGGAHREDFEFVMDGRNLREFGSRGECRSVILSLKMAEIDLIEKVKGELPVMLLDDVFSELDHDRQERLMTFIKNQQVIMTTTGVDLEFRGGIRLVKVEEFFLNKESVA